MNNKVTQNHWNDKDGNPAGGSTFGNGFAISWQNGPLGKGIDQKEPNGAFVEDVITAVLGRLQFYQASQFACSENQKVIIHLSSALTVLNERTSRRLSRGVEGTHEK